MFTNGLSFVGASIGFLVYDRFRVDLSEGNLNGKSGSVDNFLFTCKVAPDISSRDEYPLYRQAL